MPWLQLDQGTEEWLTARRGKITGSRFKDARDKLKGGQPSKACLGYAMDVARERIVRQTEQFVLRAVGALAAESA